MRSFQTLWASAQVAAWLGGFLLSGAIWAQTPNITLIEPLYGSVGDPAPIKVWVMGVDDDTQITGVAFNTTWATSWDVTGFTGGLGWQIQANIPEGATTGQISVQAVGGAIGTSSEVFLVFGPGPRPLSFSPSSGRTEETIVTLSGDRFIADTRVYFKSQTGEVEAPLLQNPAQNQLTCRVPVGAVSGPIRVASSQGSNHTATSFEVIQDVDLRVALHSEPTTGVLDQALTLVTTVVNQSASSASGVIVTNLLDPSLTYVSGTTSRGSTVGAPVGGKTTAVIGTLSGAESATVSLVVLPTVAGQVTTSGGAFGNEPDPDETNNEGVLQTTVVSSDNDLGLGMAAEPEEVFVGEAMIYTITVTNLGPLTATGVQVVDTLPSPVTVLNVTVSQGARQIVGNRVTALLGALPVGGQADVRIFVTVDRVEPFSNTATVTANEPDPNTANNSATLQTTPKVRSADLGVVQSVQPEPPGIGVTAEYRIVVNNNGPETANQVNAVNVLSTNVLFLSATASPGSWERTGNVVTANLGNLDNGGSGTLTIRVVHKSGAPTTNRVDVSSLDVSDPEPGNNRSESIYLPVVTPTTLDYTISAGGVITLSWPALPSSWRLQERSSLSSGSVWVDVAEQPEVIDGRKQVEIDPATKSEPQTIYQLISPL
jgi:uncharacterized repeat protein (TIGR01451 family)